MPSLEQIQRAVKLLKRNAVRPRRVRTKTQALRMTKLDVAGHIWHVGERYYALKGGGVWTS